MRSTTAYITLDNSVFLNIHEAKKHAEKEYGDLLLRLTRELSNQKYTFVSDFIDENLKEFVLLKELRDDILLPNPTEDDE